MWERRGRFERRERRDRGFGWGIDALRWTSACKAWSYGADLIYRSKRFSGRRSWTSEGFVPVRESREPGICLGLSLEVATSRCIAMDAV